MTELMSGCKDYFHIILIGTKADYWEELMNGDDEDKKANLTTWQEGYDVARAIGAKAFIQTSAKTYQGIRKEDGDNPGGLPDTQVDPQGQYLKDMICSLRLRQNKVEEVPIVQKVVALPAAAESNATCANDMEAQLNADLDRVATTAQLVKRAKAAGVPLSKINMCWDNQELLDLARQAEGDRAITV